jgi:hypothetical protein
VQNFDPKNLLDRRVDYPTVKLDPFRHSWWRENLLATVYS